VQKLRLQDSGLPTISFLVSTLGCDRHLRAVCGHECEIALHFRIYRSLLKHLPQLVLSLLYTKLQAHLLRGEGHEYHLITGKEGQAPLGMDEFTDMPELRKFAELCAVRGLDQEYG
jgi:hypothetical protein